MMTRAAGSQHPSSHSSAGSALPAPMPLLTDGGGRGAPPALGRAPPAGGGGRRWRAACWQAARGSGASEPRSLRGLTGMGARSFSVLLLLLLLAAAATPAPRDGEPRSCEAVRKVFQLRQLGSLRGVPEFPRAGEGSAGGPAGRSGGSSELRVPLRPLVGRWGERRMARENWHGCSR